MRARWYLMMKEKIPQRENIWKIRWIKCTIESSCCIRSASALSSTHQQTDSELKSVLNRKNIKIYFLLLLWILTQWTHDSIVELRSLKRSIVRFSVLSSEHSLRCPHLVNINPDLFCTLSTVMLDIDVHLHNVCMLSSQPSSGWDAKNARESTAVILDTGSSTHFLESLMFTLGLWFVIRTLCLQCQPQCSVGTAYWSNWC